MKTDTRAEVERAAARKCPRHVTLTIKILNESENNVAKISDNQVAKTDATYLPIFENIDVETVMEDECVEAGGTGNRTPN